MVSSVAGLRKMIPIEESMTHRWDREWLRYFATEDARVFFTPYDKLKVTARLHRSSAEEVFTTPLTSSAEPGWTSRRLGIWVDGAALAGKRLLEIGCGPGYLGKQLGLVAREYVGIDYSRFALSLARLTAPSNCHFYHLSELDELGQHAGKLDTMVGREFFIHQNYRNARWVLELGAFLLKPGGLISADFYLGNPDVPQGVIHPAKRSLDRRYPSCGFQFKEKEICEIASAVGLTVEAITDRLDFQRRFVLFRRP